MASAAAMQSMPIETAHEDMIHDAQLDYYGKRLATCSSDRSIRIFDVVEGEKHGPGYTLRGHTGPVWQVAWAHPKYGHILASCSYDGKVLIWKEQPQAPANAAQGAAGKWTKIKEYTAHTASVNAVSWAPHELGPMVACASSDGKISVLTFQNDGQWNVDFFNGHAVGCTAVSWAPAVLPGSLIVPFTSSSSTTSAANPSNPQSSAPQSAQSPTVKRFASAGCDNKVKIWVHRANTNTWQVEDTLEGHTDWVRDVAWAPNIGLPRSYIATASQDKTVCIWTKDSPTAAWVKGTIDGGAGGNKFPDVVWRVSWSTAGNILAVSCGDGKVTLWKENLRGVWECVSEMTS